MDLQSLATELKRQARQGNQIVLNESTFSTAGLSFRNDLDQLISQALDLASNTNLTLTISEANIPTPSASDTSMTIVGGLSFLNTAVAAAEISFEIVNTNELNFIISAPLSSWTFSQSFPTFSYYPFDQLKSDEPHFLFSSFSIAKDWTWKSHPIHLESGLNYASFLSLENGLAPAYDLIKNYSPSAAIDAPLVFFGSIDIKSGMDLYGRFPAIDLKAVLNIDGFSISFLEVAQPFIQLAIQTLEDEELTDYTPALFLVFDVNLSSGLTLELKASFLEDSGALFFNISPKNPLDAPDLDDVLELMAGQHFNSFVPPAIESLLSDIAFKGLSFSMAKNDTFSITSIQTVIGSKEELQIFDQFKIKEFDFIWNIIGPGSTNNMMGYFVTQFSFFPTVFNGLFEVDFSTDLEIAGRFSGDVSINDLVREVSAGKLIIPADLVTLSFSDFELAISKNSKTFELESTANVNLSFYGHADIAFQQVRFAIKADFSGAQTDYSGSILGLMKIGDLQLFMSANHPGTGLGWVFDGRLSMYGAEQNLTDLTASLFTIFKGSLPAAVPDILVSEVRLSYDTDKGQLSFSFHGTLKFDQTSADISIFLKVVRQGSTYTKDFKGKLSTSSVEFDLDFSLTPTFKAFAGAFKHFGNWPIHLKNLVLPISSDLALLTPEQFEINISDALFAYIKAQGISKIVFSLDIAGSMNLSDLPLVGKVFPKDKTLSIQDLKFLAASKEVTQDEVQGLQQIIQETGIILPQKTLNKGLEVSATIDLGSESKALSIPASSGQAGSQNNNGNPPSNPTIPSTPADKTKWFTIQKGFGPVYFSRVGIQFDEGILWFMLDAALTAAGLTISLDGLGIGSPLKKFEPQFQLNGLGIDFKKGPLEIGGAFLRYGEHEFDGMATIKTEELSLTAIGMYATVDNHKSLFIYAILDYPLGGPAFFFVTGLAAGFGYNRALKVPTIDQLERFPLITEAIGGITPLPAAGSPAARNALTEKLDLLRQYVPVEIGQYFLAVGIKFTSFKLIDSFALLVVSFGHHFEIDVMGISSVVAPPAEAGKAITPLAVVQMAFSVRFIPDEGALLVDARLTSASYILSKDCHLQGGFAFYSWFSGPHAGDFVQTLGGFHPDFKKPSHYPSVPRLGFNWQVISKLTIKGDAYYALTSTALMAGGHLEANYHDGNLKAWFKAGADFLIAWKPYHYDAKVYISIGGSYDTFLGTISVNVGADLHIWGPEFAGTATINLSIISIKVSFGDSNPAPQPIDWHTFRTSFLPPDDAILSISLDEGLVRTPEKPSTIDWIVNPKQFSFSINSIIPNKQYKIGNTLATEDKEFGISPMDIDSDHLTTTLSVDIKDEQGNSIIHLFEQENNLLRKRVPTGLWGTSVKPNVHGAKFIENALTGFRFKLKRPSNPAETEPVYRKRFQFSTDSMDAVNWESTRRFDAILSNDELARKEVINKAKSVTKRTSILSELGFSNSDVHLSDDIGKDFLIAPQVGDLV